jgi:hypothetical protein
MTRPNTQPPNLGPYILAFVAGAIALSRDSRSGEADRSRAEEDARVRAAIADKLLDRLAGAYRATSARRRPLL